MMPCAKDCRRYKLFLDYACQTCSNPGEDAIADNIIKDLPAVPEELSAEIEYAIRTRIVQQEGKNPMSLINNLIGVLADPILSLTKEIEGFPSEDDIAGIFFDLANDCVRFATRKVVGRVKNLVTREMHEVVSPKNNFYHFYEGKFIENPLPLSVPEMDNLLDYPYPYVAPIHSKAILDFISARYPSPLVRKRIETCIDVGCAFDSRNKNQALIPQFEYNGKYWYFRHPSIPKDCIIHEHSNIRVPEFDPSDSLFSGFLCEEVYEDGKFIYLNVIRKMEDAIRTAFYDTQEVRCDLTFNKYDIDAYPTADVLKFPLAMNKVSYDGYESPVISTDILYNVLYIISVLKEIQFRGNIVSNVVNINVTNGREAICFDNERNYQEEPIIDIAVMPIVTGGC